MLKNTGLKIASIKAAQTALLAIATVLAGCSTTGSLPPAPVSASQADYSYVVAPATTSTSSCGAIRSCR